MTTGNIHDLLCPEILGRSGTQQSLRPSRDITHRCHLCRKGADSGEHVSLTALNTTESMKSELCNAKVSSCLRSLSGQASWER